ncbi:replication-associated recombination protein A [Halobacteriovorax marinus]|uniref:replication-associated recombination protein A n=1 Tax=Halobacteriovorax marinus TaxID=97084 RepID=UPI003A8EB6D8
MNENNKQNSQSDLFSTTSSATNDAHRDTTHGPLPFRARPESFENYFGQEHIFTRYKFLKEKNFPSLILWGPPGTGKTTLAHILAANSECELYNFNAVLGGVNELKKLITTALQTKADFGREAIIFVDEIHRFNKAQQDALLPYVEQGSFKFIGATTENPRSSVNKALLSRVQIIELKKLSEENLVHIIENVSKKFDIKITTEAIQFIGDYSNGDARNALNILEVIEKSLASKGEELGLETIRPLFLENAREYDRNKDRHYDVISAFIKSMRGSDPNSAILWLAVMLDGGEDPVFIARRLVIFASEDIGNADPTALSVATSCLHAVAQIGMPEARINLAQATTYLASTVKSNAAYNAINAALAYVESNQTIQVPDHLKNFPPKDTPKYKYPHSYPHHFVKQDYSPEQTPEFYFPTEIGVEKNIKERLKKLWQS